MSGTRPRKLKRDILRIVTVVLLFGGAAWALGRPEVRANLFDIAHIRAELAQFGWSGQFVFLGVCALLHGLGVPRLWICAVSGSLFGAASGAALAHLATLLGASINFFTGRWLLRGPVNRRLPTRLRKWYDRFEQNGLRWILYARLFPLSNATVVNLVCGASHVKFRDFFWATLVGYAPFSMAFALFGSAAAKQKYWQLGLGAVLFGAVLATRFVWKKYVTGSDAPMEEEEEGELEPEPVPPPAP